MTATDRKPETDLRIRLCLALGWRWVWVTGNPGGPVLRLVAPGHRHPAHLTVEPAHEAGPVGRIHLNSYGVPALTLDWLHECEATLTDEEWRDYLDELERMTRHGSICELNQERKRIAHASADDRATAFLGVRATPAS